jgi:tetratricopeptide (TPR) repeat protein
MKKVLYLLSLVAFSAIAGTNAPVEMGNQSIDRIKRDLDALQAFVYRHIPQENQEAEEGSTPVGASAASLLLEKITALETQVASLVGRLEESEFLTKKMKEEFQQYIQSLLEKVSSLEMFRSSLEDKEEALTLDKMTAEELYERAIGHKLQGNKVKFEKLLRKFTEKFTDHTFASTVYYHLANLVYESKNSKEAAFFAAESYKKDPKSAHAPDALMIIALCLQELEKSTEACTTLQKIETDYPTLSPDKKEAIQKLNLDLKCSISTPQPSSLDTPS